MEQVYGTMPSKDLRNEKRRDKTELKMKDVQQICKKLLILN